MRCLHLSSVRIRPMFPPICWTKIFLVTKTFWRKKKLSNPLWLAWALTYFSQKTCLRRQLHRPLQTTNPSGACTLLGCKTRSFLEGWPWLTAIHSTRWALSLTRTSRSRDWISTQIQPLEIPWGLTISNKKRASALFLIQTTKITSWKISVTITVARLTQPSMTLATRITQTSTTSTGRQRTQWLPWPGRMLALTKPPTARRRILEIATPAHFPIATKTPLTIITNLLPTQRSSLNKPAAQWVTAQAKSPSARKESPKIALTSCSS